MTREMSAKTEHPDLLAELLRSAQMSLYVTGSDSFIIPLETIRAGCGEERAAILQLFNAESVVVHGGFTIRYDAEKDRVIFNRVQLAQAGAPTSSLAPVAATVPAASMSPDQVAALARQEWQDTPSLHREFTSENTYIAFRKAEAAGLVRILGKAKVQ